MSEVLQDLSPPALVNAIEENLFGFFQFFRCWPQAEVHDGPDMLWTLTDIPCAMFNNILRAQLAPDNVHAAIEATIARGKSRNVPMLWWTGPATRPVNLGENLEAHGFIYEGDSTGMAIDLKYLNEDLHTLPDLTIERVGDLETLKRWSHIGSPCFGFPDFAEKPFRDMWASRILNSQLPFRCYIGLVKGKPVAISGLFLFAGVAGIYAVATQPEARRQGIGAALTLAPLREARALGYLIGILQSSEIGFNVYHKVAFILSTFQHNNPLLWCVIHGI